MRAYCYRVGYTFTMQEDGKCPECGQKHAPYGFDTCGHYVQRGQDGSHCVLPPEHHGKCSFDCYEIAEAIHEQ